MHSIVRLFILTFFLLRVSPATAAAPDLSGSKGETVFFLLGMLDEYTGRQFMEDGDHVERFYCNEHVPAFVFRAYIDRLAREQGLDPAMEAEWKQDCLVFFHSHALSAFINQFYAYEFNHDIWAETDAGRKRISSAHLEYKQFEQRNRALTLAYLAGAYFRYGADNLFEFANSSPKRDLICRLLEEMGCDSVATSSQEGLPYRNGVSFIPTEELQRAFESMPAAWAFAAADSMVGLPDPDELAIYELLIRGARDGVFEGCPLDGVVSVPRFTVIPMRREEIPGGSAAQRAAMAGYYNLSTQLLSLGELRAQSVHLLSTARATDGAWLSLGRIGFSRDRTDAATIFVYRTGWTPTACGRHVAVFLARQGEQWVISGYATKD